MNEDDKALMELYGIKCVPKMVYFYKQYEYENLKDALRYAEIDTKRDKENTLLTPAEGANNPNETDHQ